MHTMTAQVLTTLTCAKMPAVQPIIASALSAQKSTQWRRQRMSSSWYENCFDLKGAWECPRFYDSHFVSHCTKRWTAFMVQHFVNNFLKYTCICYFGSLSKFKMLLSSSPGLFCWLWSSTCSWKCWTSLTWLGSWFCLLVLLQGINRLVNIFISF